MKALWRSRTLWLAYLIAALGVVQSNYPLIQHLMPEKYQGLIFVGIAAAVAVLRAVTTKPLSEK